MPSSGSPRPTYSVIEKYSKLSTQEFESELKQTLSRYSVPLRDAEPYNRSEITPDCVGVAPLES